MEPHGPEITGTSDDTERSPEEIERDIAGTREALESTVEELGERLQPGQLAGEAGSYVREKTVRGLDEAWQRANQVVRDHPVPLALIGGGLVALVVVRQATHEKRRRRKATDDLLARWLDRVSEGSEWMAGASERAGELGTQALERARGIARQAQSSGVATGAQRARGSLEGLFEERPLLAGVASFALGALLGGAGAPSRSSGAAQKSAGAAPPA